MNTTYIKLFGILFAAMMFGLCAFASAGETPADRMGISVNAANRNSALLRESQSRETRDINSVNSTPLDYGR